MNSLVIVVFSFAAFFLAYKFYASFLSKQIFNLDPVAQTPAHQFKDGVDYVPAKKFVLFGHHFTSIAGAAPIVGPAIAVIWGWLPALIWVVFGTIFMGAVHDFGALIVSARNKGQSIGELSNGLISPRARTLFLLIIFFLLWIVIAVFALIIALLFIKYPQTILPVAVEMVLAVGVGFCFYKTKLGETGPSLVALAAICVCCYLGILYPFKLGDTFLGNELFSWIIIILLYAYLAAVLPVWILLQPRDYINSQALFLGLGLMYVGLVILHPPMVAPAIQASPAGAPSMIPFLFIVVACGAVSGFHSLVSSGTSAKQLNKESDAKLIGYGAMVGEGVLAVMAIIACTAGFPSLPAWRRHYASWGAARGLGEKIGAFVSGGGKFLTACGLSPAFATAVLGVIIIGFAMTSIDTATRLQRYTVSELSKSFGLDLLGNRYIAGVAAVGSAYLLAIAKGGKGGLALWPLFGTSNQLLAGLALLVVTLYLFKQNKPIRYTLFPMLFIMAMTVAAMVINLKNFINTENWLLTSVGTAILLLATWLIYETWTCFRT